MPPYTDPLYTIRTPKLYHSIRESNDHIMEYMPNGANLKDYALRYWAAPTDPAAESHCFALGKGLGAWIRSLHTWSDQPEQASFREAIGGNKVMQALKHSINYPAVIKLVDRFPSVLGGSRKVFEEVCDMAAAELLDESQLGVIHGDYWTGKYVLPTLNCAIFRPLELTTNPLEAFCCHLSLLEAVFRVRSWSSTGNSPSWGSAR